MTKADELIAALAAAEEKVAALEAERDTLRKLADQHHANYLSAQEDITEARARQAIVTEQCANIVVDEQERRVATESKLSIAVAALKRIGEQQCDYTAHDESPECRNRFKDALNWCLTCTAREALERIKEAPDAKEPPQPEG